MTVRTPGRYDIVIRKGDTYRKPLVFGGAGFTPTDLTGFTARLDIRDPDTGALLVSLTTTNGKIIMGDTDLTVTLYLTDTETKDLAWSRGVYDFELKDTPGTGDVVTYLEGEVCVVDEVTTTET